MADLLKPMNVEAPSAGVEVASTEQHEAPAEQSVERSVEVQETVSEQQPAESTPSVPVPQPKQAMAAPAASAIVQKDDVTIRVEKILEEGLGEMYATLPPDAKLAFRARGEQVSHEIATMVRTFRVKVSQVLRLIRSWLHTIPGVNKFFLEQEAKLKTDSILEYAKTSGERKPPTA